MVRFTGPPVNATRNKPISPKLRHVLEAAAKAAGVDHVLITSGAQPGTDGRSTGSTRHNDGRAADVKLIVNGKTQTFTDKKGGQVFETFIATAAAHGACGIGAGVKYMGNEVIHVGFGTSPSDSRQIAWGAKGRSANAPAWLKKACQKGWDAPLPALASLGDLPSGDRYVVVARGGLNLRKGPDLAFGVSNVLATGTEVSVLGFDGPNRDWARVDLEGDNIADGHVFAAFLEMVSVDFASAEDVEEPGEEEMA